MLQQTTVPAVVPYFERWAEVFPDLGALARAPLRRVLREWQGLGYYRRATNLHRAAQAIVRDHCGRVPDTVEALLSLPGVGRYTAGAIASIAYDRRAAVVDGNVARVLSRVFAVAEGDTKRLWELAESLVLPRKCGDFNQALMELGATVCLPRGPRCEACPLRRHCRAQGAAKRSGRAPKAAPRDVTHHMLALRWGEKYLLQQRPANGLWAKLWQMPTVEVDGDGRLSPAAVGRCFAAMLNLALKRPTRVGEFIHLTSHRRVRFVLWRADCPAPDLATGVWRAPGRLGRLPISAGQKRVLELLRQQLGR